MIGYRAAATQPAGAPAPAGRPVKVATVIARLEGGAGQLALRGAQVSGGTACQHTIVTGSGGPLLEAAAAAGLEVIVERSLRAPIAPHSDVLALRRLAALLRGRGFDVVHTHCSKAGVVGRLAAHRAGVGRLVHTYHGFGFHEFQSAARRSGYVMIERYLGKITDVALCVGAGVAAEAVRRGLIAPDRVRTIGVLVDGPDRDGASLNARSPEARARARAALGLPPGALVVGAVGRLAYQKAPEDFAAAMRKLNRPDVIGVWIGGGELSRRARRHTRALPPGRISWAGERPDVLSLLPALDVFALPSLYEGLPTAVVEAMVCGVPVVATAVNAVPDLVVPGETGLLVPPRRPDLLATAIGFLLASPSLAARMAATAQARVADRYRAPELRAALLSAYAPGAQDSAG